MKIIWLLLIIGIFSIIVSTDAYAQKAGIEWESLQPEELNELGFKYYNGDGVNKDNKEAVNLFRRAAELGNFDAQRRLGLWPFGQESTLSGEEAAKWLRMAAEQGGRFEQYEYGVKCLRGEGVTQDDKEAEKWFRKAADQGYKPARFLIEVIDAGASVTNNNKNKLIRTTCINSKTKEKEIYYENDTLATKLYYIDGKVEGAYKSYYPNGNIMVKAQYKNGHLDGSYEKYFDNGKLSFEVLYVNGKQDGEKYYNKNKIENDKKINSNKWTILGLLSGHQDGHDIDGNYLIKSNKNGATIKKEDSDDLIYLSDNCDVYSKVSGKGTWKFFKMLPGFSIHFDNDEYLSSNIYGNGLKDDFWYEKMPNQGSKCYPRPQQEIIPANSCSSDPLLNSFKRNFPPLFTRLATHGWKSNPIDLDSNCSGTGVGYCRFSVQDCTGRTLYIETAGGFPPQYITQWAISGPTK